MKYGISFWPHLVTVDELGNKTDAILLPISSVMPPATFTSTEKDIQLRILVYLVFILGFCRYLVEFDSKSNDVTTFRILFMFPHALMCQGHCFQMARPTRLHA